MATFKIKTTNDLKKVLKYAERHVKFALEEVAKVVEKEIKNYIMVNLYNKYEPKYYTRTYNYINSLSVKKAKKVDNGYVVEIFFDTDKIMPLPPDGDGENGLGRWSRHSSITSYLNGGSGDDMSDMIPLWMEYGVVGSLWDRDGIYSIENNIAIMKKTKYHLDEIKKVLESRGIKVEIV